MVFNLQAAITKSRSTDRPSERSRGFTLLELMLVLAIIALIGAIVTPRFAELFDRQRLEASAEQIRLCFDRTRLEAMKTGQAQVFKCMLETGDYAVTPLVRQVDSVNSGAGATVMSMSGSLVETQADGSLGVAELEGDVKKLEADVTFFSCQVASDMRAYNIAQVEASAELNTTTVGQTLVFYPDGSTSNAEVRLQNKKGEVRAVRLRGLTGHSRIIAITNVPSSQ